MSNGQQFGPQRFGTLVAHFGTPSQLALTTAFSGMECRPYVFSKRAVSKFKCIDCKVNVLEAGDWYMCDHELWLGELGLLLSDNLCFDCLEERLERPLRPYKDVHLAPRSVKGIKLSERWYKLFVPESWRPKTKKRRAHRRAAA
jgi:hypothetical protein